MKKLSTEEFVEKAKNVHGNKYDYSFVEYVNAKTKVKINCFKHGFFLQLPGDHLRKKGCLKCAGKNKTTEIFIDEARNVHKNLYDYNKTIYSGPKIDCTITCCIHGDFTQTPNNHLQGKGCRLCGIKKSRSKQKLSWPIILKRFEKIHGKKYDYNKTKFENVFCKIVIICKKHGQFEQLIVNHLKGANCPKCNKENQSIKLRKNSNLFFEQVNKVHNNKYKYFNDYINDGKKISIYCPKHGIFKQTARNHLKGSGCRKCFYSNLSSKSQIEIFNYIKNENTILEKEIKINNRLYKADICFPNEKIIIEYNGDYWHCNPKKYNSNYFHPHKQMTAKQIWEYDRSRQKVLENIGYKVFITWESEFKQDKCKTISKIKKFIKSNTI